MNRRRGRAHARWATMGLLSAGLAVFPALGYGQSWEAGVRIGGSVERLPLELSQSRFVSSTTLPRTETTGAMRLRMFGETRVRPTDVLGLTLGLDTGLFEVNAEGTRLDRRPVEEQLPRTLLLGRALAEVQLGPNGVVALRAGRSRPRIGAGAVYDAYAFSFEVDVDFDVVDGPPVSLLARALLPDGTFTDLRKTSPLLDFELSYRFGWQSRITLMASVFFDTDSELVDPVRSAMFKALDIRLNDPLNTLVNRTGIARDLATQVILTWLANNLEVDTEGVVAWTGASGRFGDDRYSIELTALGAFGNIRVTTGPTDQLTDTILGLDLDPADREALLDRYKDSRSVAVQAFFAQLETHIALSESFDLRSFALVLTGDEGLTLGGPDPKLGAFVGLAPLLPRTAVFFGGTFGPDQATPTAFSVAPDASGILAAGAGLSASSGVLSAELDGAIMSALVPSRFTGGTLYGLEVDLRLRFPIYDPIAGFIDGGILFPGAFFEDRDPAVQFVAGVQIYIAPD